MMLIYSYTHASILSRPHALIGIIPEIYTLRVIYKALHDSRLQDLKEADNINTSLLLMYELAWWFKFLNSKSYFFQYIWYTSLHCYVTYAMGFVTI